MASNTFENLVFF